MAIDVDVGSDFDLTLTGVRDAATGDYLNNGTAPYTLYDSSDQAVSGGTGSLSYVAASDGNYRGVVESTQVTLLAGRRYYALVPFVESGYNQTFRIDITARDPGGVIIDVNTYQERAGALSSGDQLVAAAWCRSVSRAIENACRPFRFAPVTLTNQIYDAPLARELMLRVRPVRSITSIYYRSDVNGVAANFTGDYLLDNTDNREFMLDVDDDLTGYAMKGWVLRTNREWGYQWWRPPGQLASRLQSQTKCLLVNYKAGFDSVPDDVVGAAAHLVTKMMKSRRDGTQIVSESWNGYSKSLPASAVGNIWADPYVADLLRPYRCVHVPG